jgi:hypothetical protein
VTAGDDLPCPVIRDLPEPPRDLWRIVGPGVVAAGVGISSGEFILWPYIASQAGLVFLWGAVLGIVTQFFINMEIDRSSPISESLLYFRLVWGLVAIGCTILLAGLDQPLVLLVISASVGGTMMCLYSGLLIHLNRRRLPDAIKILSYRVAALVWATAFFGFLAALTMREQLNRLFG